MADKSFGDAHTETTPPTDMLHRDLLVRLCEARERLGEPSGPAVPEVAHEVGMSAFHFARLYRAVFGQSPHQARVTARIDQAKSLLARTGLSVTEVCAAVGYESLGTFSALFTRREGQSPTCFRRAARERARAEAGRPAPLVAGCFSLMGRASVESGGRPENRTIGEAPGSPEG